MTSQSRHRLRPEPDQYLAAHLVLAAMAVAGSLMRIPLDWRAMLRCRATLKHLRPTGTSL